MLYLKLISIKHDRTINARKRRKVDIQYGGYNFSETGNWHGLEARGESIDIERGTVEILVLSVPSGASEDKQAYASKFQARQCIM